MNPELYGPKMLRWWLAGGGNSGASLACYHGAPWSPEAYARLVLGGANPSSFADPAERGAARADPPDTVRDGAVRDDAVRGDAAGDGAGSAGSEARRGFGAYAAALRQQGVTGVANGFVCGHNQYLY